VATIKCLFKLVMTLPQCSIELQNVAVSDTTEDDGSNQMAHII